MGQNRIAGADAALASGGEMIDKVSFSGTTFNTLPFKFEAGTPISPGPLAWLPQSTLSGRKTGLPWCATNRHSPTI